MNPYRVPAQLPRVRRRFGARVVLIIVVALAVIAGGCAGASLQSKQQAAEDLYRDALVKCAADFHTRVEIDACRAQRRREWNVPEPVRDAGAVPAPVRDAVRDAEAADAGDDAPTDAGGDR